MNLKSQIELYGYGTSEGVRKEWDERGRGRNTYRRRPANVAKYSRAVVKLAEEHGITLHKAAKHYQNAGRAKDSGAKGSVMNIARRSIKGIKADSAAGQTDGSSLIGRKYFVIDTRYGHIISEHDMPDGAEQAAQARPYSKVVSKARGTQTQQSRDLVRQRLVSTNPDVD